MATPTPEQRRAWREANAERIREYQRQYRATHPRTAEGQARKLAHPEQRIAEHKRWKATLTGKRMNHHEFVAIDGEGWNHEGRHVYTMIATSDPTQSLYTGEPLSTIECLAFLADLPTKEHLYYVSFFFDYDVTMILRDFALSAPELAAQLFRPGTRQYVWWEGFGIKYRPHKQFTVKRWDPARKYQATTIHDGQGFFQTSFVNALRQFGVGTPAEVDEIERMKSQRGSFTVSDALPVLEYSREECRQLVELTSRIRDLSRDVGLNADPYEGPGGLAGRALTRYYGKSRHAETLANMPEDVRNCAPLAMYGGRFETLAVGPVPGAVTEFDLKSAYPAVLRDLPCLIHGRWSRTRKNHADLALSYVEFSDASGGYGAAHPLPVRRLSGELFYPRQGAGWYWRHEYERPGEPNWTATPLYTWSWKPSGCDCQPFSWVADLYRQRERMEAMRKGSGIALKLTLNTLYGKMAQTKPTPGAWLNFIYASIITSVTRRRVFDIYRELPRRSVLMFATDAVFVTGEHPGIGKAEGTAGLGEFEHAATYEDLTIIQPGMYFDRADAHFKTRGIPRAVVQANGDAIRAASVTGESVTVDLTQFRGLRMALMSHGKDMGEWVQTTRTIQTRTTSKRTGEWRDPDTGILWTAPAENRLRPAPGMKYGESVPRRDGMLPDIQRFLSDLESDDDAPGWSVDGA